MLARLFVLIGGLVVLVLTAALVGPYFIDWTSYRADFEREASRILGRQVTVGGEATARLLPFPSLAFTEIEVAGERPGEPRLTIESFSMDAELAPLLRGELLIVDMRIERPRAIVEIGEDGRIDWTLNPAMRLSPEQVGLERISITDGELRLRLAVSGREHMLDDIDATLAAKTLAGPWHLDGSLDLDGRRLDLLASTGALQSDGSLSLRLQARPELSPVLIETDGTLQFDRSIGYAGNFRLASRDPATLETEPFRISVEDSEPPLALDYRIAGEFEFDHRRLEIPQFRLETGEGEDLYTAEGTAFLDHGVEPHFNIAIDGQQMRLHDAAPVRPQSAQPFERRLAALQSLIETLPHPATPGTVELRLPAIIAGDTTVRELRLAAQPVAQGWRIRQFSAQLPGRATLEADGLLVLGEEAEFHGNLLLAVAQPSGFAAWLASDVDDAIRRIGSAGLAAKVTLSGQRQSFRELELILGQARFTGEIDHHVPGDARPSMLLRLEGDALDLDGALAFGSLFVDASGAARYVHHDLDLEVTAGPVSAGGLTAARVDTALRIKQGRLEIDRLSISDLAGATISATGSIHGIPERPSGTLDAAIVATDLAPLARLVASRSGNAAIDEALAARLAVEPELLADASLNLVAIAAGNADGSVGLAVSANGLAGGSTLTMAGSATRDEGAFGGPVSLTLSLRNPDPARILATLGLPALPVGPGTPAEIVASLRGRIGEPLQVEASLRGEDIHSSLVGTVEMAGGEAEWRGRAEIAAADIEPWLGSAGIMIPGLVWGTPVELGAAIRLDGRHLALDDIAGEIARSAIAGSLSLEMTGDRPQLGGELEISHLDLEPLLAMVTGVDSVPMAGAGWAEQDFAPKATLPFRGDIALRAGKVALAPLPPLDDARMRLTLGDAGIGLHELAATIAGGRLAGNIDLANDGGTALLSTQLRLDDLTLAGTSRPFGIDAAASLSASLTASGRSFRALAGTLAGSGSVAADRVTILGLSPHAFADILRLADSDGDQFDSSAIAELALGPVRSGTFTAENTQLAFTVAGGIARSSTLMLKHPQADLETSFSLNLTDGALKGEAQLAYKAGREALVGAEPAIRIALGGTAAEPEASYDAAPLARYLAQRALEIEQARVEAMQERLLERQRLRRELREVSARIVELREREQPDEPTESDETDAPEAKAPESQVPEAAAEIDALVPAEPAQLPKPAETDDSGKNRPPQDAAIADSADEALPAPGDAEETVLPAPLPAETNVIPVRRQDAPPMRLTPLPEAAAPQALPAPGLSSNRPAEPQRERRGLFDLLFQSR